MYWLRVAHAHVSDGVAHLLDRLGPDTMCICESTTLRKYVEPSVFLLVRADASDTGKQSFRELIHIADKLVHSDGTGFDLNADELGVVGREWVLSTS